MNKIKKIQILQHRIVINGKKTFLISADYPYYRDTPANWKKKVKALQKLAVDAITFYIPWRHHASWKNGKQKFDFTGTTAPNRNVIRMIQICHELGIMVIAKPGPFIHAETVNGGLPDFVTPGADNNTIQPMTNARGKTRVWWIYDTMPSPVCPAFQKLVKQWFQAVDSEVLKPLVYPQGPIISIQICNEGIYTDSGAGPEDFDYSPASLQLYQTYCKKTYKTIDEYNRLHGTRLKSFAGISPKRKFVLPPDPAQTELLNLLDWRVFQNYYTATILKKYGSFITTAVPQVTNAALPYRLDYRMDYWICRNSYYNQTPLHPGFTNWVGLVSHSSAAFDKYLFAVKYIKGINWEENWGFSKLYDPNYKYPVIPYYQTLLAVALGAKGYNIYTGAATDQWDAHMVTLDCSPYPTDPPITAAGTRAANAGILHKLNIFLKTNEHLITGSEPDARIAFVFDLHYSAAGSFKRLPSARIKHLVRGRTFKHFMHTCTAENIDFGLHNISCEPSAALNRYRILVVPAAFFMSKKMQRAVISALRKNQTILWYGELPRYNETIRPCTLLRDYIIKNKPGHCIGIAGCKPVPTSQWRRIFKITGLTAPVKFAGYRIFCQRYTCPETKTSLYFIFSRSDKNQKVKIDTPEGTIEFNLTAHSALAYTVRNGFITSALIKSINEMEKKKTAPRLLLNRTGIHRKEKKDIVFFSQRRS